MAGETYYLQQGYVRRWEQTTADAIGTIAILSPNTSNRIILTGLCISSNPGGSILISVGYRGMASSSDTIAEFYVAGSSTVHPELGPIEVDAIDRNIYASFSASGSNGWKITATGFEME